MAVTKKTSLVLDGMPQLLRPLNLILKTKFRTMFLHNEVTSIYLMLPNEIPSANLILNNEVSSAYLILPNEVLFTYLILPNEVPST